MIPAPGPQISASELRPRRRWYLVALACFAAFAAAGIALLVSTLAGLGDGFRQLSQGADTTISLSTTEDRALYRTGQPVDAYDPAPCQEITRQSTLGLQLTPVTGSQTLTLNGTTWTAIANIRVSASGSYTLRCQPAEGVRYAVGKPLGARFVAGIVGFFALPGIGLLVGGGIALVTLLRRSGHKQRLLAERGPPTVPPGGPVYRPPPPRPPQVG